MSPSIEVDPERYHGTPCFRGTRVPVKSLFDHLVLGYTINGFLQQFPTVKREDAIAVLDDAAAEIESHAVRPWDLEKR